MVASSWCLVHLGVLALLVIPLVCTRLGFQRCAALWAENGGGIIFVPPGKFAGQHKILPVRSVVCFVVFDCFKLQI